MKEYDFVDLSNVIEVINFLNDATIAYEKGTPIISDKQWDDLYFKLDEFEKNTGVIYANSPTQRLTPFVCEVSSLIKVPHNHPMLSLAKTKSLADIEAFCGNFEVIAMAKMDGLTCSLKYEYGKLVGAETRGNGIVGEDVFHNVRRIKNVPLQIPNTASTVVIDGEVICTYKDFEPFSTTFRNPRNFAAGSVRLLDSEESLKRNLSFIAWDLIEGVNADTLSYKLDILTQYGFDTVPWVIENPKYAITDIQDYCKTHSYPIDGIVFKYNNCDKYESMGRTEHHFNGGIAYKFYDDLYETQLLDIEWSMGKTGVLTPIAIFEPVETDGSIVERASLHNVSLLNDVFHGQPPFKHQSIRIYKANQIIPQVYDASYPVQDVSDIDIIKFPDICPHCGKPLSYRYEGVSEYCFCDNSLCPGKLINQLEHFFGKKGLDIKGLSESTFEKLIDWGWVNSITDVFHLESHKEEWIQKPGFGPKSVENLLNSINAGRRCELSSFLAGLGIPLVGTKYAKLIAKNVADYVEFRNLIIHQCSFMEYDGIGPEINDSILHFNYDEADKLDACELTIINTATEPIHHSDQVLQGKTFVITGKLQYYKNRDLLVKDIEHYGGKVVNTVTKNTNYLINNDRNSTSSKNKAAKQLNIPIITEETLKQLMNGDILYVGTAQTKEITCEVSI